MQQTRKALVDATDYRVDPSRIRGFKFRLEERILPWLIEEYCKLFRGSAQ